MKQKQLFIIALMASMPFAFWGCTKEDNHQHNDEEELITQVKLILIDTLSNDTLISNWSDRDGIGGNNPILPDTLKLKEDKMYFGKIEFYTNHDAATFHDITPEILTEANNHIICYNVQTMIMPPTSLYMIRTDEDLTGKVLGLKTEWYTPKTFDKGYVNIRLKHQPGVKDETCDPGETDVEVYFPYETVK